MENDCRSINGPLDLARSADLSDARGKEVMAEADEEEEITGDTAARLVTEEDGSDEVAIAPSPTICRATCRVDRMLTSRLLMIITAAIEIH